MKAPDIAIMAGAIVVFAGVVWAIEIGNRALICRRAERMLKNPVKTDPRALEDSRYGTLAATDDGFRLSVPQGTPLELSWDEIKEISAYKQDLGTTDLICLVFRKSNDERFQIHEEMAGYWDLLQLMEKRLPGFTIVWFLDVAFPAFETNLRVIWKKSEVEDISPP
jgi:hypothetical protein